MKEINAKENFGFCTKVHLQHFRCKPKYCIKECETEPILHLCTGAYHLSCPSAIYMWENVKRN